MELKSAKKLIDETIIAASNILDIGFVEARYLSKESFDGDIACYLDRYYYVIKYNTSWLEGASDEDIIVTTYRRVRQAYQQVQIEFRDKLIESNSKIEPKELVDIWSEEFQYYTIPTIEEELDDDFLSQYCEIDSYAFAYVMCLSNNGIRIEIPSSIVDKVYNRVDEIKKMITV